MQATVIRCFLPPLTAEIRGTPCNTIQDKSGNDPPTNDESILIPSYAQHSLATKATHRSGVITINELIENSNSTRDEHMSDSTLDRMGHLGY